MSEPTRIDYDTPDGTTLAAYRWDPEGPARGIVQLTHGVGEHLMRYAPVAERLTREGYVVVGHEHRGHGRTHLEHGGTEADFGVIGADGWRELVADIGRTGAQTRAAYPDLPLALVAHSLGSFAAQQLLLDHSADVDAVVLSGTAAIDLLEPMMDLDAPMDLSAFNAPFAPARTDFDWLSRDEAQVDAYVADPWCGFGLDAAGMRACFEGARPLADPDRVAQVRDDLPVYVVVGDADPLNGGLALASAVTDRYEAAGLTDVTLVAYPGARHEVFNETNRVEVLDGMVAWLDRVVPAR